MKFIARRTTIDPTGSGIPELVVVLVVIDDKKYAQSIVEPECGWKLMLAEFRRLKKFLLEGEE